MPLTVPVPRELSSDWGRREAAPDPIGPLEPRHPARDPLPPGIPREAPTATPDEGRRERLSLLARQGIACDHLAGLKPVEDRGGFRGNIENFVGLAQVPVGIIGPLRVNGTHAHGDFYVPMATTEGALVASHNRGAKVISLSGGASVLCISERVCRAPAFVFARLAEAWAFSAWVAAEVQALRAVAEGTTRHGVLQEVRARVLGNQVHLELEYTTGDAAGQNIVTIATEAICRHILATCPVRPRRWFVEGNLSGDKKATARSYLGARGKRVTAEVAVPRELFLQGFHATPEAVLEYWKVSIVAGVESGSIGVQGHYANALAAMFIACGQDVACVAEAAVGLTRIDVLEGGELYVSVSLPNLIVGTVGGGTSLPTQRECLTMLGCEGTGRSRKLAEICASTVLAGELSLTGALAAGEFTQAHVRYGRKPG